MLFPVDRERHRARFDERPGLELPERLSRARVQGEKISLVRTAEYEAAGRRQDARPRRRWQRKTPRLPPGLEVERTDCAYGLLFERPLAHPGVVRAGAIFSRRFDVNGTHLARGDEQQTDSGIV